MAIGPIIWIYVLTTIYLQKEFRPIKYNSISAFLPNLFAMLLAGFD